MNEVGRATGVRQRFAKLGGRLSGIRLALAKLAARQGGMKVVLVKCGGKPTGMRLLQEKLDESHSGKIMAFVPICSRSIGMKHGGRPIQLGLQAMPGEASSRSIMWGANVVAP